MTKIVFLIKMLSTFSDRCNRYFWDKRLKILRLPKVNMLFPLVLTKVNCFRVYRKLITWSSHEKSLYTCTCTCTYMLRNMMAHVTTFGIVLHNIIMIANVRICTRIRVILRFKNIIIRNPHQFSVHEEVVSYFNDVHCLPLPVTTHLFADQFVSRV